MLKLPVDMVDVVWICRMCEHMAETVALGGKHCAYKHCGGPMCGKGFPLYRGPLKGLLQKYCYSCGEDSGAVLTADNGDKLGVCVHCLQHRLNVSIPT